MTAVTESRDVKYKELQSRLGLSKMSNKKYRCPHCEQTSSRRWNLEVHLKRRHQAAEEPGGPSQAGFAFIGNRHYRFKPGNKHSGMLGHNNYPSVDFNTSYRSDGRGAYIDSKRNSLDDTTDYLRRALEIKRLTKELNPQYQQLQLFMPSTDHVSLNYNDEFIKKLDSLAFSLRLIL